MTLSSLDVNAVAIIPARGGSKGIPRKNLVDFCGHPLLAWSVAAARRCQRIERVYVSTDCEEIADTASRYGAEAIHRPEKISGDAATSESALLHACEMIASASGSLPDAVVMLQATSPLRETSELEGALKKYADGAYDAMFSAAPAEDFLIWRGLGEKMQSVNYDWRNRVRRQDADASDELWIETGSFYITRTELLRETGNRLGGRVGTWTVPMWKSFEIDSIEGLELCEILARYHSLDTRPPEDVIEQ